MLRLIYEVVNTESIYSRNSSRHCFEIGGWGRHSGKQSFLVDKSPLDYV